MARTGLVRIAFLRRRWLTVVVCDCGCGVARADRQLGSGHLCPIAPTGARRVSEKVRYFGRRRSSS